MDGISNASNARSIYVQSDDRMTEKVANFAKTDLLKPAVFLRNVKLPQLAKSKIEIDGLGHDTGNPIALFQSRWLFYRMKNVSPKTFSKLKGKSLQIEMELSVGDTKYSEVKMMKLSETTNKGNFYKLYNLH